MPDFLCNTLACSVSQFGISEIIALACALVALFVSGFVSGSEIAYFSLTPAQLEDIEDSPQGAAINRLLSVPQRLLATILITNNLVNVTIVVLVNFALGPVFESMPAVLSFILQSVILTFLILLFGEILPKLYANNYPLAWARFATGGLTFLYRLFSPLSRMLVSSTSIMNRVVTKQTANITANELSQALEITDVAQSDDRTMLQGILKFGDTTASEIMTPRIDVTDIPVDATLEMVLHTVTESGYSRLPVYRDTLDHIEGILYARDLLPYVDHAPEDSFSWHSLLRKPYYVPESKMIDTLLEDFRRMKIHMAIVIDEFGGTRGIVTMEDIMEEIVGDINDEFDDEEKPYKRQRDGAYIFEGRTLLNDFFRITGLAEDEFSDLTENAETLAGLLLALKGDFPKEKEPLAYKNVRFMVLDLDEHRINSVRVKILSDSNGTPA